MTPTPISGLFEALALLGVATLVEWPNELYRDHQHHLLLTPRTNSEDAHAALERKKKMIRMMMLIVVLAIWAMMMVKIQSVASHSCHSGVGLSAFALVSFVQIGLALYGLSHRLRLLLLILIVARASRVRALPVELQS
uniref:Uncharacterized protein n=1 Tax=Ananas comosus var. bracteatus TaxID=296719 RepID=A0A6V7PGX5_ANACO|nr:unnamed protein product [Ananas comosus var. bracteatus]